MRRFTGLLIAVPAAVGLVTAPLAARADDDHHHGPDNRRYEQHRYEEHRDEGYRGGIGPGAAIAGAILGLGAGALIAGSPRPQPYYAPPPVVYAAPPAYYAPPPVMYSAPPGYYPPPGY